MPIGSLRYIRGSDQVIYLFLIFPKCLTSALTVRPSFPPHKSLISAPLVNLFDIPKHFLDFDIVIANFRLRLLTLLYTLNLPSSRSWPTTNPNPMTDSIKMAQPVPSAKQFAESSMRMSFTVPPPPSSHHVPFSFVGFANLPNQVHRKSVRKGFQFTCMVVGMYLPSVELPAFHSHLRPLTAISSYSGESGLGKSTLINTLFNTTLYAPKEILAPSAERPKTVAIQSISAGKFSPFLFIIMFFFCILESSYMNSCFPSVLRLTLERRI
jgi:hypothetical protein